MSRIDYLKGRLHGYKECQNAIASLQLANTPKSGVKYDLALITLTKTFEQFSNFLFNAQTQLKNEIANLESYDKKDK